MKLIRYKDSTGNINTGKLDKDSGIIEEFEKDFLDLVDNLEEFSYLENKKQEKRRVYLDDVTLLSPVAPGKVIGVGLNYKDHAREFDMEIPENPLLFLKPSTSVIAFEEGIKLPSASSRVDYEGELAIVVRKETKNVTREEGAANILGYTCANDVTARDLQKKDGQWTRAKSFDTFSPLGPWIETDIDPGSLKLSTRVNGIEKQNSSTAEMIFSPSYLISFISEIMTLEKGDVIITGTPPGVGPLEKGDNVEVEIEGIGILKNHVI